MRHSKAPTVLNDRPVISPNGCAMRYRGQRWLRYKNLPGVWAVRRGRNYCPDFGAIFHTEDGRRWQFTKGEIFPQEYNLIDSRD